MSLLKRLMLLLPGRRIACEADLLAVSCLEIMHEVLRPQITWMSPHQLRGYTRARAGSVLREYLLRQEGQAGCRGDAWPGKVLARAVDRLVERLTASPCFVLVERGEPSERRRAA